MEDICFVTLQLSGYHRVHNNHKSSTNLYRILSFLNCKMHSISARIKHYTSKISRCERISCILCSNIDIYAIFSCVRWISLQIMNSKMTTYEIVGSDMSSLETGPMPKKTTHIPTSVADWSKIMRSNEM